METGKKTLFLLLPALPLLGAAAAQWPKVKLPEKIPGLADLFERQPPLTTSLRDAVTEVPFLDDFAAVGAVPLSGLPRTSTGSFLVPAPGYYMIEARSYCLQAGTHAPGEGDGYLLAPHQGPWAAIVRNVLRRSVLQPEITQQETQTLLWAILSRAKIEDMSPRDQAVATKLLTPKELTTVNGGAIGLIPRSLRQQALDELPPEAQRLLEVEAELREALTRGTETYEEIERLAVLQGEPPPQEGDRLIPRGRWSYHPEGYFIRYLPRGYRRTLVEIHVPAPVAIGRDELGRITRLEDAHGCVIQTDYADAATGDPAAASAGAYAFRSIYCERRGLERSDSPQTVRWEGTGWTLTGSPIAAGDLDGISSRFPGARGRQARGTTNSQELQTLCRGVQSRAAAPDRLATANLEELLGLAQYFYALDEVAAASSAADAPWRGHPSHLVKGAWQWALVTAFGAERHFPAPEIPMPEGRDRPPQAATAARLGHGVPVFALLRGRLPALRATSGGEGDDELDFDLSPDGAQPGKNGSQRLGPSNGGSDMDDSCADWYSGCKDESETEYWKCTAPCLDHPPGSRGFRDCLNRCVKEFEHSMDYCRKWAQNCLEGKGLPGD